MASTSCHRTSRPAWTSMWNLVVLELRRRGLFRTEYQWHTLREHLRLLVPANCQA